MYEIDVEFTMQSEESDSSGFGMMLLKKEPEFPEEFGSAQGFRNDYNGVGVFLIKSTQKNPGKWVSLALPPSPLILIFFIVRSGTAKQGDDQL